MAVPPHTPRADADIAHAHTLEPVATIADRAGIPPEAVIPYGHRQGQDRRRPACAPTPGEAGPGHRHLPDTGGEGKSTVLIGLADALRNAGHRAAAAIREPSQGPVMGIKGGAAGGGYAQIVPMEDINLHFTGDFHAISAATNTLAALIDNHIHQGNRLGIDPRRVTWQRCVDVNDRSLREVTTGLGGPAHGVPRETGFTITAASELMAILCLAEDLADLKRRIGRITVGTTYEGTPVTVDDLRAAGALTALLKHAVNPNLVQTLGGTPAFVHGGPFANIAHGCNSLLATRTALQYSDVVVTEAGFGSDLGAEKFFDIKSRAGGLNVDGAVVVASIRSLKYNGGAERGNLDREDLTALRSGVVNLERHVGNVRKFGVEPVVALNLFASDSAAEREVMADWARRFGVALSEVEVWAQGGAGAADLGEKLMANLHGRSRQIYDPGDGVKQAIRTIAREIYRAEDVEFGRQARKDLAVIRANGWDTLPVCISKTQYSFSDDPQELGATSGHTLHVRELLPRTGAGFIVALTGDVMTMPGLPKHPTSEGIDVDEHGRITGLF